VSSIEIDKKESGDYERSCVGSLILAVYRIKHSPNKSQHLLLSKYFNITAV